MFDAISSAWSGLKEVAGGPVKLAEKVVRKVQGQSKAQSSSEPPTQESSPDKTGYKRASANSNTGTGSKDDTSSGIFTQWTEEFQEGLDKIIRDAKAEARRKAREQVGVEGLNGEVEVKIYLGKPISTSQAQIRLKKIVDDIYRIGEIHAKLSVREDHILFRGTLAEFKRILLHRDEVINVNLKPKRLDVRNLGGSAVISESASWGTDRVSSLRVGSAKKLKPYRRDYDIKTKAERQKDEANKKPSVFGGSYRDCQDLEYAVDQFKKADTPEKAQRAIEQLEDGVCNPDSIDDSTLAVRITSYQLSLESLRDLLFKLRKKLKKIEAKINHINNIPRPNLVIRKSLNQLISEKAALEKKIQEAETHLADYEKNGLYYELGDVFSRETLQKFRDNPRALMDAYHEVSLDKVFPDSVKNGTGRIRATVDVNEFIGAAYDRPKDEKPSQFSLQDLKTIEETLMPGSEISFKGNFRGVRFGKNLKIGASDFQIRAFIDDNQKLQTEISGLHFKVEDSNLGFLKGAELKLNRPLKIIPNTSNGQFTVDGEFSFVTGSFNGTQYQGNIKLAFTLTSNLNLVANNFGIEIKDVIALKEGSQPIAQNITAKLSQVGEEDFALEVKSQVNDNKVEARVQVPAVLTYNDPLDWALDKGLDAAEKLKFIPQFWLDSLRPDKVIDIPGTVEKITGPAPLMVEGSVETPQGKIYSFDSTTKAKLRAGSNPAQKPPSFLDTAGALLDPQDPEYEYVSELSIRDETLNQYILDNGELNFYTNITSKGARIFDVQLQANAINLAESQIALDHPQVDFQIVYQQPGPNQSQLTFNAINITANPKGPSRGIQRGGFELRGIKNSQKPPLDFKWDLSNPQAPKFTYQTSLYIEDRGVIFPGVPKKNSLAIRGVSVRGTIQGGHDISFSPSGKFRGRGRLVLRGSIGIFDAAGRHRVLDDNVRWDLFGFRSGRRGLRNGRVYVTSLVHATPSLGAVPGIQVQDTIRDQKPPRAYGIDGRLLSDDEVDVNFGHQILSFTRGGWRRDITYYINNKYRAAKREGALP